MGFEYLFIAFFFGLATAIIGRAKGSSFWIWLLIGTVLPPLGLIAVDPLPPREGRTRTAVPHLPQGGEALRPGLPPLRHRPLPARPGRGSSPGGAGPRRSAQPGPDDRVGEAEAVADDRRLLRVAVEALGDGHRDLLGGDARLIASIMNSEVWNCSWRRTSWGRTVVRTAR